MRRLIRFRGPSRGLALVRTRAWILSQRDWTSLPRELLTDAFTE
jgi:hypothetical protein